MPEPDPSRPYLDLAGQLFDDPGSEGGLKGSILARVRELPLLDETLLDRLARISEAAALSEPRRAWAIAAVADQAARSQSAPPFLEARAAWDLARAANHWSRPKRVAEAVARARRGFETLDEPGWLAACEWQSNAQAWTKPDFAAAAKSLERAVSGLEEAGMDAFVPHCRLALSYAQILTGNYDAAEASLRASEEAFVSQGDRANQGRCLMNRASALRRRGHFADSIGTLEQALAVFEGVNAAAEIPKVHYQIALAHLLMSDSLPQAEKYFTEAARLFDRLDLELWRAACSSNLGSVHLMAGKLPEADRHFRQARETFARHETLGLLAGNLNDAGKLSLLRGRPLDGIRQFGQAEALYARLGMPATAAVVRANLGEACAAIGRYQDALHYLEGASNELRRLGNFYRLGACEKFIALTWIQLGRPDTALEHLDEAAACHEKANQQALLPSIYLYKANILSNQGNAAGALENLEMALRLAEAHGVHPLAATAHRLLGEVLTRLGRPDEALSHLEQARSEFSRMGILTGEASSWVSLGDFHATRPYSGPARAAYEQALHLGGGISPEVEWQAHAGLAKLAEDGGEPERAILSYRKSLEGLAAIRRNFWQPALGGAYARTPAGAVERGIGLAARLGDGPTALEFIENAKAATLLRQLAASAPRPPQFPGELAEMKAQIHWLQDQLAVDFEKSGALKSALQTRSLRAELARKIREYDARVARLEREGAVEGSASLPDTFHAARFRERAASRLGDGWAALEYYLAGDRIVCAELTPDTCRVHRMPISRRMEMALEACLSVQHGRGYPSQGDFDALGRGLVPDGLAGRLTPDTVLLLAPHGKLHSLPWAALGVGRSGASLVSLCVPALVPSLNVLAHLWDGMAARQASPRRDGLVIGLSAFGGRHRDLPHVRREVETLGARLGDGGHILSEAGAAWEGLLSLRDERGLSRFDWLHIASHVIPDRQTGRLSEVALYGGNASLDQLRDLSPLPGLVTLSACNGIYNFTYEGDEHVGLPAACLVAGAKSIVGSAWPVLDEAAADFTQVFYDKYLDHSSPARALAAAQREMIASGQAFDRWGSFVCVGLPE